MRVSRRARQEGIVSLMLCLLNSHYSERVLPLSREAQKDSSQGTQNEQRQRERERERVTQTDQFVILL